MTINMSANSTADYSKLKVSGTGTSSASSSVTSELTEEEKNYDVDGDGTLSLTEEAAYLEAKSKEKALESVSNATKSNKNDAVSISDEALKLQKEGRPQGPPPDVSNMSDMSEQKNRLSENEQQSLMQQAITEYNKFK